MMICIHSFIQQIVLEYPFYVRNCADGGKQKKQSLHIYRTPLTPNGGESKHQVNT